MFKTGTERKRRVAAALAGGLLMLGVSASAAAAFGDSGALGGRHDDTGSGLLDGSDSFSDGYAALPTADPADLGAFIHVTSGYVWEGGAAALTVTLNPALTADDLPYGELAVDYETIGGTATVDVDYRPVSGTVYLTPDEPSSEIRAETYFDDIEERDETFRVRFTYDTGDGDLAAVDGQAVIRSQAVVGLAGGDRRVCEGTDAVIGIEAVVPAEHDVTVSVVTSSGTAIGGVDYDDTAQEVTLPAFRTSAKATIGIASDDIAEYAAETFIVRVVSDGPATRIRGNVAYMHIVDESLC